MSEERSSQLLLPDPRPTAAHNDAPAGKTNEQPVMGGGK
jgi:hypothetical protein